MTVITDNFFSISLYRYNMMSMWKLKFYLYTWWNILAKMKTFGYITWYVSYVRKDRILFFKKKGFLTRSSLYCSSFWITSGILNFPFGQYFIETFNFAKFTHFGLFTIFFPNVTLCFGWKEFAFFFLYLYLGPYPVKREDGKL